MQAYLDTFKQGLCPPAIIYMGLFLLNLITQVVRQYRDPRQTSTVDVLHHILTHIIMGGLIWFLCYQGYTKSAWAVLAAPVVIAIMLLVAVISVGASKK